MIQELFGMMDERKISIPGGLLDVSSSASVTLSPASSLSSSSSTSEPQQSLRCPRCDSSNTKFCYYNNYNLTQPRHFCKTCRRYWTKGGALRNVPIGGGCRKAKPSLPIAITGRSGSAKAKPASPDVAARLRIEQELPSSSPIMWATPYSSQLLNLLRTSQFQNANPNPNSHVGAETAGVLGEQSLSLDPFSQIGNSLWGNRGGYFPYHHHHQPPQLQQQQQQQQQHNVLMGEVQNPGIQELLQKLRPSANYDGHHLPAVMNNVGSAAACSSSLATAGMATSTSASILEPLPLAGADFGYWNPAFSWADLPATNGAFP